MTENESLFTWRAFQAELVERLLSFHDNRRSLLELLAEMKAEGMMPISLNDQGADGQVVQLTDIDPFTFLTTIHRSITPQNRVDQCRFLKQRWALDAEVPADFHGIPVVNNQSAWFFPYGKKRQSDDIDQLWALASAAHAGPEQVGNDLFTRCLAVHKVALAKLTMGLFWLKPERYLALDRKNRSSLEALGINPKVESWDAYLKLLMEFQSKSRQTHWEFSHDAHLVSVGEVAGYDSDTPGADERFAIPGGARVWVYAPGENAYMWDDFFEEEIAAIGWDYLGDLSAYESKQAIIERMLDEETRDTRPTNDAKACWDLAHEVSVGDVFFVKRGLYEILGAGVVTSDYRFDTEREAYRHVVEMDWQLRGNWQRADHGSIKTLTEITPDREKVQALVDLVNGRSEALSMVEEAEPVAASNPPYTDADDLASLFMAPDTFRRMKSLLRTKKNLVLQGPPGVGKSFVARRLAFALMGERDKSRVAMVQFHQSYAYEDFIQGYRPAGEQGGFALRDGVFYRFARQALQDPGRPYVFIIDEINRGNLSRIFGELMLLIEHDKRSQDYAVALTYSPTERFYLPENLHLIGLMNTADRSLAMVDYALRRRFAFVDLEPEFRSARFVEHLREYFEASFVTDIVARLEALNTVIAQDSRDLGKGFCIGHSFFCINSEQPPITPESWYQQIISAEIEPLLHEYWADKPEKAREEVAKLRV
ncbi:MAG: AAA family ATPase [Opitutales bacterium]